MISSLLPALCGFLIQLCSFGAVELVLVVSPDGERIVRMVQEPTWSRQQDQIMDQSKKEKLEE